MTQGFVFLTVAAVWVVGAGAITAVWAVVAGRLKR